MLKAGYLESGARNDTKLGTMQGGILSPLLSNVYLNDFDWYVGRIGSMEKEISQTLQ